MHPLLSRQIRRHLGDMQPLPEAWQGFFEAVSDAYSHGDQDRNLIEHALEEMSQELTARNEELRRQLEERCCTELALQREKREQAALIEKLATTQEQLLQSEKLASIGQLAAGVAHEINNPVGYVHANLGTLEKYLVDLFAILDGDAAAVAELPDGHPVRMRLAAERQARELDYLRQDVPDLLRESREGLARVRKIVQDLREFSHPDEGLMAWADLHQGLDSTLNIVYNELKYKAEVVKDYGELPPVQCNLSQLNQVFMNLLVNAAHAIEGRGTITLHTGVRAPGQVFVEIRDTGCGIPPAIQKRIFDPFFTTKPVGKGTGLGLSLSYGIVQRHHGVIELESHPGQGSTFRVCLPVAQPEPTP